MATLSEQADAKVALLNSNVWQLGLIVRDRVQWLNDYHHNPIDFLNAALIKLKAVQAEFDEFEEFLNQNSAELNMKYYSNELESFRLQIQGFSSSLPVPKITMEIANNEQLPGFITKIDDGDTVFINDIECRLAGIDAAEGGTDRGKDASAAITELVTVGTKVTLKIDPHTPIDVYGRALGVLFRDSDGLNINLEMLKRGKAEVTTKFPRHKYVDQEEFKQAYEKYSLTFPNYAILKLYSDPTHADVFIDGIDVKQITPAEIPVQVGKHHIELVKYDHASHHEDIDVIPGANVINRRLIKLPATEGLVIVKTEPNGLEVLVDGLPAGMAPVHITLSANESHTVSAEMKDGRKDTGTIMAIPGKTAMVTLTPG